MGGARALLQSGGAVLRGGRALGVRRGRRRGRHRGRGLCGPRQVRAHTGAGGVRVAAAGHRRRRQAGAATRGRGVVLVGSGRRVTGVAPVLHSGHGRVRYGTPLLYVGGAGGRAEAAGGRRVICRHGVHGLALPSTRRYGRAGADVCNAADHHVLAGLGADATRRRPAHGGPGGGSDPFRGVRHHLGLRPFPRACVAQAGMGDVHVLPGAAGHGVERHPVTAPATTRLHKTDFVSSAAGCGVGHGSGRGFGHPLFMAVSLI